MKMLSILVTVWRAENRFAANASRWKALCKDWSLMSKTPSIQDVALNMAEAIREWNRAKMERESWKPVVGQVPPVGILGSAKKANVMLSKALEEYEAFQQSVHPTGGTHSQLVSMVNSLANIIIESASEGCISSNDLDYANDCLDKVIPLLKPTSG